MSMSQPQAWLKPAETFNQFVRFLQTGFDLGLGFLHLSPMLFTRPDLWGKTMGRSIHFMCSPRAYEAYMAQKTPIISEMVNKAGMKIGPGTAEMMEVMRGRMARVGKKLILPDAFERQFSSGLTIGQIEAYQALKPLHTRYYLKKGLNPDDYLMELGSTVEKLLGSVNMTKYGISGSQHQIEGLAFYAPRYFRSILGILLDAAQGGFRGDIARKSLGSVIGSMIMTYYASCKALGQEPKLDPRRWDFMSYTVTINGQKQIIKPGGNIIWAIRTGASIIGTGIDNPKAFLSINSMENPLLRRIFRSKISVIGGLGWDLVTGKTYLGETIWDQDTGEAYNHLMVPWALERLTPFWLDWEMEKGELPQVIFNPFETWGLNQFAYPLYQQKRDLQDMYAKKFYSEFGDLYGFDRVYKYKELPEALQAKIEAQYPELAREVDRLNEQMRKKTPGDRGTKFLNAITEINKDRYNYERLNEDEVIALAKEQGGWSPALARDLRDRWQEIQIKAHARKGQVDINYKDIVDMYEKLREEPDEWNSKYVLCYNEYVEKMFNEELTSNAIGNPDWDKINALEEDLKNRYGIDTFNEVQEIIYRNRELSPLHSIYISDKEDFAKTIWQVKYPEEEIDRFRAMGDKVSADRLERQYYDEIDKLLEGNPDTDARSLFWGYRGNYASLQTLDAVEIYLQQCDIRGVTIPNEVSTKHGTVPTTIVKDVFTWYDDIRLQEKEETDEWLKAHPEVQQWFTRGAAGTAQGLVDRFDFGIPAEAAFNELYNYYNISTLTTMGAAFRGEKRIEPFVNAALIVSGRISSYPQTEEAWRLLEKMMPLNNLTYAGIYGREAASIIKDIETWELRPKDDENWGYAFRLTHDSFEKWYAGPNGGKHKPILSWTFGRAQEIRILRIIKEEGWRA